VVHDVSLTKPEIKAVQYSYGKEYCASQQEAPHCLSKASEDVCEPCNETGYANE
jgi:hypothetical protein